MDFNNGLYCTNCGKQLTGRKGLASMNLPYIRVEPKGLLLMKRIGNKWRQIHVSSGNNEVLFFCGGACIDDNFEKQEYLKNQYHQLYPATVADRLHHGVVERAVGWWKNLAGKPGDSAN